MIPSVHQALFPAVKGCLFSLVYVAQVHLGDIRVLVVGTSARLPQRLSYAQRAHSLFVQASMAEQEGGLFQSPRKGALRLNTEPSQCVREVLLL